MCTPSRTDVTPGVKVTAESEKNEYKSLLHLTAAHDQRRGQGRLGTARTIICNKIGSDEWTKEFNAFLNSKDGGTIHFGISDDCVVEEGISLTEQDRDQIEMRIGKVFDQFWPTIRSQNFKVYFIQLENGHYRFDVDIEPSNRICYISLDKTHAYTRCGPSCLRLKAEEIERRILDYEKEEIRNFVFDNAEDTRKHKAEENDRTCEVEAEREDHNLASMVIAVHNLASVVCAVCVAILTLSSFLNNGSTGGRNAVNIEDRALFQVCERNKYIDDIQMEIPANVLGNDEFEVTVVASSSGEFVYGIEWHNDTISVGTLELKHCCPGTHRWSTSYLTFAVASNSQETLCQMLNGGKFKGKNFMMNRGSFNTSILDSSQHIISFWMHQRDILVFPTTYYLVYFYIRRDPEVNTNCRWEVRIAVVQSGSLEEEDMERKYTGWKKEDRAMFRFAEEEVHLGLGGSSTTSEDGCWTVSADKPDRISREEVDQLKIAWADCSVVWNSAKCVPKPYRHTFNLYGAQERIFRTIFMSPNQVPHSSGALYDRPDLLKLRNLPSKSGSIDIIEQIGTDYSAFGIQLLNDGSGARVEAIVKECRDNAEQINLEILRLWILGRGKPVSWYTLIHVLRVIKRKTLAGDIEDSLRHYTINT